MVTTKMNWSGPNVIHFGIKSQFGRDHFILVETKSLWSSPNQFGQTKTILDRPKLFWSHRKTRHKIDDKMIITKQFIHIFFSDAKYVVNTLQRAS